MPQETYSFDSLDEDVDEDRNENTRYAPSENMLSAAREIISCLDSGQDASGRPAKFLSKNYAIQGGYSMQLRGGRQSTRDIDLITSLKMKGVWDAITGNERIVIPDSRLVEGVIKVFVKTGPGWDACAEQHKIEVDIKQAGFRSSPRNLGDHTEIVGPVEFLGEELLFRVLDVASMIRIKIDCCLSREEPRDFEDVKYLIRSYSDQVQAALQAGVVDEDDLLDTLQHARIGNSSVGKELAGRLGLEAKIQS